MLPINETLAHFFNNYGGASYNTTIEIYELQDMHRAPRIYNTLTRLMDINSFLANIEGICSEINDSYPIDVIDMRTGRTITLQPANGLQFFAYRIEVTIHES
ncbi:hypothetical protein BSK66_12460 [Paenibacillus odorifer]|uniref:hypothetical protein n=1 Tax=Paenibacillus TaxID=44249 RepID=UPI0003E24374|nr:MULTISPECIES: hypothetical protein [Paenibacillus]ETT53892.1 hypothetical protein C171_20584 [Paenibacillus sp. FSL H8-237]OME58405.1 hypothetical protein BSK66_12460 [Paenibacillus odorifer]